MPDPASIGEMIHDAAVAAAWKSAARAGRSELADEDIRAAVEEFQRLAYLRVSPLMVEPDCKSAA